MVGTAQRWHTFKLVAAGGSNCGMVFYFFNHTFKLATAVGVIVEESFALGSNCRAALPVETVLAEQQFWKSSS